MFFFCFSLTIWASKLMQITKIQSEKILATCLNWKMTLSVFLWPWWENLYMCCSILHTQIILIFFFFFYELTCGLLLLTNMDTQSWKHLKKKSPSMGEQCTWECLEMYRLKCSDKTKKDEDISPNNSHDNGNT